MKSPKASRELTEIELDKSKARAQLTYTESFDLQEITHFPKT